jgi:hypothetical protein
MSVSIVWLTEPLPARRVAVQTVTSSRLYRWTWRTKLPERRGQLFRVLALATKNSCLIEFVSDGAHYCTSQNALRPIRDDTDGLPLFRL